MRSSLSHQLREVVGDLDHYDQADREDAERDAGVSISCSGAQEGKASWRDCGTLQVGGGHLYPTCLHGVERGCTSTLY